MKSLNDALPENMNISFWSGIIFARTVYNINNFDIAEFISDIIAVYPCPGILIGSVYNDYDWSMTSKKSDKFKPVIRLLIAAAIKNY